MPNISVEELGNLTARVTVNIPYAEYGPKVKKELNKYQKKSAFKGFRPGKAPMSFIRKMYGQQVMANEMNNLLQDSMMEYLEDKDIFGQPVPVDQIESFNLKSKQDYDFVFEVGFEPKVDVVLPTDAFNKEVLKIDDKYLDRELRELRHRQGEVNEEGDEVTSTNDVIKVKLQELENGEIKEGGVESETYLGLDLLATAALQEKVMGLKPGDTFEVSYKEISKEFTEDRIKRYILKMEMDANGNYTDVNEMFRAEIVSIRQVNLAELNQEFFNSVVGEGAATTEEEFRTLFGQRVVAQLSQEANTRLFMELQKTLIESNDIEFPEAFLKKWLLFRDEKKTEADIDAEMPDFLKSLKWMMIKGNISKAHNVEASESLIREAVKNQFRQYMQGQVNDEMLNMFAEQVLNSDDEKTAEMRERAYQEAMDDAVFIKLQELVTISESELTTSEFDEILTKEYEKRKLEEELKAAALAAAAEDENLISTEIEEAIVEMTEEVAVEEVVAEEVVEEVIDTELEAVATEIDAEVETMVEEIEKEIAE